MGRYGIRLTVGTYVVTKRSTGDRTEKGKIYTPLVVRSSYCLLRLRLQSSSVQV